MMTISPRQRIESPRIESPRQRIEAAKARYQRLTDQEKQDLWDEEEQKKIHPRADDGTWTRRDGGQSAGVGGKKTSKIPVSMEKMGARWYAMADLPGGRDVTRSHETREEAMKLAHDEIRANGFEPKEEEKPVKVTCEKMNSRWYSMADLPDGQQIIRSDENRDKSISLAHQSIRASGFEPEEEEEKPSTTLEDLDEVVKEESKDVKKSEPEQKPLIVDFERKAEPKLETHGDYTPEKGRWNGKDVYFVPMHKKDDEYKSIHETAESANQEARLNHERDIERASVHEKTVKNEEELAKKKIETDRNYADVHNEGDSALTRGKRQAALEKRVRMNGSADSIKSHVEKMIEDGRFVELKEIGNREMRVLTDGDFFVNEKQIGKFAMDYAEKLIAAKKAEPESAKAPHEMTADEYLDSDPKVKKAREMLDLTLQNTPHNAFAAREELDKAEALSRTMHKLEIHQNKAENGISVDDSPHDGDVDENGLIFRDGRWHRDQDGQTPQERLAAKNMLQQTESESPENSDEFVDDSIADTIPWHASLTDDQRRVAEEIAEEGNLESLTDDSGESLTSLQEAEKYYTRIKKPKLVQAAKDLQEMLRDEIQKRQPQEAADEIVEPIEEETQKSTEDEIDPAEELAADRIAVAKARVESGNLPKPLEHAADVELSNRLADVLDSGETIDRSKLFGLADSVHGGTRAEGKYHQSQAYDSLEAAVNKHIAKKDAINPTVNFDDAVKNAEELENIVNQLPTQTNRSGEKDSMQQFSTPPHYSYAVAWAASMKPGDDVLEPSAGTGSLAVYAKNAGADVYVNELGGQRADHLRDIFGKERVTEENAEQIGAILPGQGVPQVDEVLMNPPFSQTAGRMGDKMDLMTAANHIGEAAMMLKPGGRLVSIVGRGMSPESGRYQKWFRQMEENGYHLRANILVDGDVYKKYGTHFDSRVLMFDKTDEDIGDTVTGEVTSIHDLMSKLKGLRDERANLRAAKLDESGEESSSKFGSGENVESGSNGLPGDATGATGDGIPEQVGASGISGIGEQLGTGSASGGGIDALNQSGTNGKRSRKRKANAGSSETTTGQVVDVDPKSGKPGGSGTIAGGKSGTKRRLEYVANTQPPTELELEPIKKSEDDGIQGGELKTSLYETWKPQAATIKGAKPHPSALVESAAMASVSPPEMTYRPLLSPDVLNGKISEAQLENIAYAGQAHSQWLDAAEGEQPVRRGFFIGDGTGSAKGRQIAGIIADNFNHGGKKAVWLSKTNLLSGDGQRDFADIGLDPNKLMTFDEFRKSEKPNDGTLFLSYATLRDGPDDKTKPNNLQSVVEWLGKDFDGVIAFDEAHMMGNAIQVKGKRGMKKPSMQALAGVELQKLLPKARIVYSSATGATEVSNLAYADRLGIWGRGTPFADVKDFVSKMQEGGIAAMEAVAQSLKATGSYAARSLSMDGVEHERMQIDLSPKQIENYDKLADAWSTVLQHVDKAVEASCGDNAASKAFAKKSAMSQFWGSQQRFFNQILTAMQTPDVIKSMEKDIAEGRSPVVGIVNTMEAATKRAKSKQQEGDTVEDMDVSPGQILSQYLEKSFPIHRYEQYADENGNELTRLVTREIKDEYGKPVKDAAGNPIKEPVVDPQALAEREKMLDMVGSMVKQEIIPQSPLDMIIKHFGVDNIAEATGRTQRIVYRKVNGELKGAIERRNPSAANDTEAEAFQSGKKKILIFSDAGGTGRSYHASRKAGNQGRRVHYMLQPGWRADSAMQALGRTHRTNQSSAPIYKLPSINQIPAQKRFISTIARRLDQLGALGKGQRQTGGGGLFAPTDNLESPEASDALDQFFTRLKRGGVKGISHHELMQQMGFHMDQDGNYPEVEMPQFLNRMLSLKVGQQSAVFNAYEDVLKETIQRAQDEGTLDSGMENYKAHSVTPVSDSVIYRDPVSKATTRHIVAHVKQKSDRVSFDEIKAKWKRIKYVKNKKSGRVWAATPTNEGEVNLYGPTGTSQRNVSNYDFSESPYAGFSVIPEEEGRNLWDKEYNAFPEFDESDQHFVTGALLPVWDKLPQDKPKVYRVKLGDKTVVGRHVPTEYINNMLDAFHATEGKVQHSTSDVHRMLTVGKHSAELANGWKLTPKLVQNERRIELTGPTYAHYDELMQDGVIKERIAYQPRLFIPTGEEGLKVLERITKSRPVSKVISKDAEQYSRPRLLLLPLEEIRFPTCSERIRYARMFSGTHAFQFRKSPK
jgi:predicted RNA methylase